MLQTSSAEFVHPSVPPLPRKIRTLLLDDSNFDRARIRRLSQKTDLPIELDEVDSIAEMDAAVTQHNYDLIIIDYRLPVGDGMIALDHVQSNAQNKGAGKIMITGNGAVETAVQAMRGGCHDFISKDTMDADVLRSAILNAMTVARHGASEGPDTEMQRGLFRDVLLAALQDDAVKGNVVSLMRSHFSAGGTAIRDTAGFDIMIAGLGDEDEFIFH